MLLKSEVLATIVSPWQVPLLSPLYGPPPYAVRGGEHKQVLQDHPSEFRTGVPYTPGRGSAAETETGQPQRETRPGEDDDH